MEHCQRTLAGRGYQMINGEVTFFLLDSDNHEQLRRVTLRGAAESIIAEISAGKDPLPLLMSMQRAGLEECLLGGLVQCAEIIKQEFPDTIGDEVYDKFWQTAGEVVHQLAASKEQLDITRSQLAQLASLLPSSPGLAGFAQAVSKSHDAVETILRETVSYVRMSLESTRGGRTIVSGKETIVMKDMRRFGSGLVKFMDDLDEKWNVLYIARVELREAFKRQQKDMGDVDTIIEALPSKGSFKKAVR